MSKNQTIKCDVESCKYQNKETCECELDQIEVVCNCDEDECCCLSDTSCGSYECEDEEEYDGE